ncbi:MAG TPA: hypothetical protein V6C58_09000 [Allocoleopsis sp.]
MLFKQVSIGEYFTFAGSSQVWLKTSPKTIQKIGENKSVVHTKNLSVIPIGDMEKAMKKAK